MPEQYTKNPEVISQALQDAFAAYVEKNDAPVQSAEKSAHDLRVNTAAAPLITTMMNEKTTMPEKPINDSVAYVKQAAKLLKVFRDEHHNDAVGRRS
ncbi:MAG: hypothetical protein Q4A34_01620 [Candidatus Saccharibacteria bacterium]|nr:hypothetical protein [Candidatus Saccharibacteria bacterium]